MILEIPASHRDLLSTTAHGILSTLMPDGTPQSSVVWVDYDGCYLTLNTALERRKTRNMQADPRVTVLVVDPANSSRWIEVRGRVVEITAEGAEAHADLLTARYSGWQKHHFYGEVYTAERKFQETRVIVRIEPVHIALDAVFK